MSKYILMEGCLEINSEHRLLLCLIAFLALSLFSLMELFSCRNIVGISSDSLLQPQFLTKLCSKSCSQACPNIVDLYSNLAIAEETSHTNNVYMHAYMEEFTCQTCAPVPAVSRTRLAKSNGDAAPAPVSVGALSPESAMSGAADVACAPTSI